MKYIDTFAVIMIAIALGPPARATRAAGHSGTTQDLYAECTGSSGSLEHFVCLSYISGISDMMQLNGTSSNPEKIRPEMGMCPKNDGTTCAAAVQVFQNWAAKNPKSWSMPRSMGVMVARNAAWPCT